MERKQQGTNELLIDASPERVWAVLEDSSRVPEYMNAVKRIDKAPGSKEHLGATRSCTVELQGKLGKVVERCVELVPRQRLTFVVDEDELGFSKLFDDFGFTFVLEESEERRTLVRIEGFYREKGLQARVLNALVMKRKLSGIRAGILADLKTVVERPSGLTAPRAAHVA